MINANKELPEEYLAEVGLGKYSSEKIKRVNGRLRTVGLIMHGLGNFALAGMAINSYLQGDYGTAGVAGVGELIFLPATYLFERATRSHD